MSCCPGNGNARHQTPETNYHAGLNDIDGCAIFWRGIGEPNANRPGWQHDASSQAGRFDRRLSVRSIGVDSLPDQPLRRLLEIDADSDEVARV